MNVNTITLDEFKKMLSSEQNVVIVDVLDAEHYRKEHLKSAISIPLDELRDKAPKILKKTNKIITYCGSFDCPASTKAAKVLMSLGYEHVFDYKGGFKEYKDAGLPLEGEAI